MHTGSTTSAGASTYTRENTSFATTQSMWRFLYNESVTLPSLAQPLQQAGIRACETQQSPYVLLVHDWSKIASPNRDTLQRTHAYDRGYDLACSLLVSADTGQPLAPIAMRLQAHDTVCCTHDTEPDVGHVDGVNEVIKQAQSWELPRTPVHIIDREGDSLYHFRQWDAAGHTFLVRAKDARRVMRDGKERRLADVAAALQFRDVGPATYHNKPARLAIAETDIVLHRPAKRTANGRKRDIPGNPLPVRLVATRIVQDGTVKARWLLLTNAHGVPAQEVARWYYWRWRIESFFRLLKRGGHNLEQWQQETANAIAKRILVASMACVAVWELEQSDTAQAEEMKQLLMKLSGRAVRRDRLVTTSGLLAGMFVLLPILDTLNSSGRDPTELKELALTAVPFLKSVV